MVDPPRGAVPPGRDARIGPGTRAPAPMGPPVGPRVSVACRRAVRAATDAVIDRGQRERRAVARAARAGDAGAAW
jgi:hypothetical protein